MASYIPAGAIPSGVIPYGVVPSAALPSDEGGLSETILGCPLSSFLPLETACSDFTTDFPACATATSESALDAACCGSLTAFGSRAYSCYSAHAPGCLDTSALLSSLSAFSQTGGDNPCARFGTMASMTGSMTTTGITTDTGSPTSKATGKSQGSSEASQGATGGSNSESATATGGSGGSSETGSGSRSASASATKSSTGVKNKIGTESRFYLGWALMGGVLAVLSL